MIRVAVALVFVLTLGVSAAEVPGWLEKEPQPVSKTEASLASPRGLAEKKPCKSDDNKGAIGTFLVDLMTKSAMAVSFLLLGPFVAADGPNIANVVILVQAMIQARLTPVIYALSKISEIYLWQTGEVVLLFMLAALGITFGMIKNRKFDYFTKGVTMGFLLAKPLMGTFTAQILEAAGLTVCEPTPEFPGGAPCELDSIGFSEPKKLFAVWSVPLIPLTAGMLIGKICTLAENPFAAVNDKSSCKKYIARMSLVATFSVTGAFMMVDGFIALIVPTWNFMDKCSYEENVPKLQASLMTGTYIIAGVSFVRFLKKIATNTLLDSDSKAPKKGIIAKIYGRIVKLNGWLEKKAAGGVEGLTAPITEKIDKIEKGIDTAKKGIETAKDAKDKVDKLKNQTKVSPADQAWGS